MQAAGLIVNRTLQLSPEYDGCCDGPAALSRALRTSPDAPVTELLLLLLQQLSCPEK